MSKFAIKTPYTFPGPVAENISVVANITNPIPAPAGTVSESGGIVEFHVTGTPAFHVQNKKFRYVVDGVTSADISTPVSSPFVGEFSIPATGNRSDQTISYTLAPDSVQPEVESINCTISSEDPTYGGGAIATVSVPVFDTTPVAVLSPLGHVDFEMFYNPAPQSLNWDISARTFTVTPGPANFTVYTETLLNSPGQPAAGAPWPTLLSPGVAQVTISNLQGAGDLSSSPEFLTVGWSGDPTPEPKFSVTGDDAIYAPGPNPTPDEYNGPFTPDIVNVTIGKSPAVGPFVSPGMTPNPVGNPAPSWKIKFRLNVLRN